jgi:hypothetical protein
MRDRAQRRDWAEDPYNPQANQRETEDIVSENSHTQLFSPGALLDVCSPKETHPHTMRQIHHVEYEEEAEETWGLKKRYAGWEAM